MYLGHRHVEQRQAFGYGGSSRLVIPHGTRMYVFTYMCMHIKVIRGHVDCIGRWPSPKRVDVSTIVQGGGGVNLPADGSV